MKERPILFSASMVRAILAGRKTMTRRVIKPQPDHRHCRVDFENGVLKESSMLAGCWSVGRKWKCPQGVPGDQLWVRENFSGANPLLLRGIPPRNWPEDTAIWYWADGCPRDGDWTIPKPSIHIPRKFSRIDLKITNIRVERLQDISEEDAEGEGVFCENVIVDMKCYGGIPVEIFEDRFFYDDCGDEVFEYGIDAFQHLWDSINGKSDYPWSANPWVWVVEFERMK